MIYLVSLRSRNSFNACGRTRRISRSGHQKAAAPEAQSFVTIHCPAAAALPQAHRRLADVLFANRHYDEALNALDRIADIRPPLLAVAFVTGQCFAKKGMWSDAIAALRPQAESGEPMTLALLGHTLARAGQRDQANRILGDLQARQQRIGVGAFQVAVVYAGLGDLDQAFAWLDRSVDDRSLGSIVMGPTFDDLHEDPRFEDLLARLGLQKL